MQPFEKLSNDNNKLIDNKIILIGKFLKSEKSKVSNNLSIYLINSMFPSY